MEIKNNQQDQQFALPSNGTRDKFNSSAFLKQLKKVKSLLTTQELEMLKPHDRENTR
jgi:hypothetical protein